MYVYRPSFLSTPAYIATPEESNAPPVLPPIRRLLDMAPIFQEADPFYTRRKRVITPSLQLSSNRPGTEYSNPSQVSRTSQATSSASQRTRIRNLPGPQTVKSPAVLLGKSRYELMTLASQHGPVNFPVDVGVASQEANKKRKLNAKASSRFRERRKKDKEAKAASTIAQQEQGLHKVEERVKENKYEAASIIARLE
ncbi:hypothetical protein K469DRAFT_692619 [Zopfia rhizophila CBS 207.26]|uniref:BZIP domain-containing protein n=1 Tax=Zopfia rhizophila CBS 207.26 TaxID=1314779 RepID=A0A6A6DR64_9PEZI|nr:hypothetical protein K469DRAFT_692619 [Zopfia rhizophila CBS 207.26]